MDVGGGNGGMASCDAQLMQVADHIANGIQAINARFLVLVHFQIACFRALSAECSGELRTHLAPERRI